MSQAFLWRGIVAAAVALGCCGAGTAATRPHGVFALVDLDSTWQTDTYRDPAVAGVTLLATWTDLEPAAGQFTWGALDTQVAAAAHAGKQVALEVTPGVFSPAWVYAQGAAKFNFTWTLDWGFPKCSTVGTPVPWDPVYGAAWKGFIAAFGAHYASNPAVVMVKMVGVDAQTAELLLPYSALGHTPPDGLACGNTPVAPASAWKAAGYRPSKVSAAWNGFSSAFAGAFPNQQLVVPTGPWGFPPVDNNGNVVAGSGGDQVLPITLLQAASAAAAGRFAVENDGLGANWSWALPAALSQHTPLGYQTVSAATGDPTCRMNHFVTPCNPVTMLQSAIDRANTAGAEFLELYPQDVLNPALAQVVASFGG